MKTTKNKALTASQAHNILKLFVANEDVKNLINSAEFKSEAMYLNAPIEIRLLPIGSNTIQVEMATNAKNGFSQLKKTYTI